jgi:hypothetical protein
MVLHGTDQPNLWHGNTLTGRASYGQRGGAASWWTHDRRVEIIADGEPRPQIIAQYHPHPMEHRFAPREHRGLNRTHSLGLGSIVVAFRRQGEFGDSLVPLICHTDGQGAHSGFVLRPVVCWIIGIIGAALATIQWIRGYGKLKHVDAMVA